MQRTVLRSLAALMGATGISVSLTAFCPTARADTDKPVSTPKAAANKPLPARWQQSVKGLQKSIEELKAASRLAKTKHTESDTERDEAKEGRKEKRGKEENEAEEAGTDYLEAYLYYLQQRAYPNDTVNWNAWTIATAQRDKMKPARWRRGTGQQIIGASWQSVGPNNVPVPYRTYYGTGPLCGRSNTFAFHPTEPNTFYLGAAGGGLWKTTDAGANWKPLSDAWTNTLVSSIAIHPLFPNRILVGTGDFNGGEGGGRAGFGLMRSLDGGVTWTNVGSQFTNLSISSIAWDPENPNIITVAPGRGGTYLSLLYRSTDGGTTWNAVVNEGVAWSSLSYGAKNASGVRRLYATGQNFGGRFFRSDDRGATWTQLTPPVSPGTDFGDQRALRIAASPTYPDVVYLLAWQDKKIFKSVNAGATWTDTSNNFPNGNAGLGAFYNWSQGTYDYHIECSTRTVNGVPTDVVYVGLIDLVQSPDGGATWRAIGGSYTGDALVHNDQQGFAINPNNPNDALVGNDGGVLRLTYNPNADTWSFASLGATVNAFQFYKMAAHPTDPNYLIGGCQDNASPVAVGDLSNWKNSGGGDGGFSAILDANVQYTTSQNLSITKTTDGWVTSEDISPDTGSDRKSFIAPIALLPDGSKLYAASNYLYVRDESTGTWTPRLGGQLLSSNGEVQYIAIAPSDANRIYTGSSDGEVWMTNNAGTTWTQINTGTTSLPNRSVTSIAVSPSNPNEILVGLSGTGTGHLWRCSNTQAGGAHTWSDVSGTGASGLPDIPLNAIALDIDTPATTWYAGTDVGLFMTTDSGANWTNATQPLGLPNTQVNDLKAVPATRTLYAATFGRGMWRIPFPSVPVHTVSGTVTLQGRTSMTGQFVTFEFRPASGSGFRRTVPLGAGGAFSLPNIPAANYTVWIKGAQWLAKTVAANTTSGDVSGLSTTLLVGDANNDNAVDISDLLSLIGAYNQAAPATGYSTAADFNGDGTDDIADLLLLIGNYNQLGAP